MRPAILATKLFAPPRRSNWVLRAPLLARMNAGLRSGSKLMLVSAPAGFGKTTLVSEWLDGLRAAAQPKVCVAWLSVDEGDNDLAVFLNYLVAALQICLPELGAETRSLLERSPLPSIEALLLPLINELARLAAPAAESANFSGTNLVLVLDDYHTIQLPAIHEALAFLIERQPPCMHVAITTRQDPLLPLARWRARGLLTEIRLKDLRFSLNETQDFMNGTLGFQLAESQVAALEQRTEGWVAGLQLAALSLTQTPAGDDFAAGESQPAGFVESFAGTDRFVMDYLIDEVLCRQPEGIQRFLLETSVLTRFNAPLCQALLEDAPIVIGGPAVAGGVAGGPTTVDALGKVAETLRYLEQANLFLIPLDHQREWYRYHHLFAELLQHRLAASGRERAAELRRTASVWCAGQGLAEESISYAQAAGDWALCAQQVARFIPLAAQSGQAATALRWITALPEKVVQADPRLCRLYGYLLTVTGKLNQGQQFLSLAMQFPAASPRAAALDPEHLGSTLAFSAFNACLRADFEVEIEQAQRALALLPPHLAWERGMAAVNLGIGLCHTGDMHGCEAAMHEAYQAGLKAGSARTCQIAMTYLGRMSILHLKFDEAEAYFEQSCQVVIDGKQLEPYDMALFDLAQLSYERNELDKAHRYVEHGMETNRLSSSAEMRAYGLRLAARLAQLRGAREQAWSLLDEALQMAKTLNLSPLTISLNGAMLLQMALEEGRLLEAERGALQIGSEQGLYSFVFMPELARVPLHLRQGRRGEALAEIDKGLWRAQQPGWEYPRLQVRVLQALTTSDLARAAAYLREALALAAPVRAVRAFVDLGEPMRALLANLRAQASPAERLYIDYLLAAFPTPTAQPARSALAVPAAQPEPRQGNHSLIEPLSDREIEVLLLLADGLTNAEIAARLVLSPNTLKAHTQNIYSKLDVHSRVQAINKARELGLL